MDISDIFHPLLQQQLPIDADLFSSRRQLSLSPSGTRTKVRVSTLQESPLKPISSITNPLLCLLLLASLLAGCTGGRINSLGRNDPAAFGGMLTDLQGAKVIFVGEIHDQRSHHQLQLDIMSSLHKRAVPLAIGLEMFDMESQEALDRWVGGTMGLREFGERYRQNWTIDWTEYDSILLFARNNRIPLIGLNPPADLVRKVARGGWQALLPVDKERLPAGVHVGQNASYREFLKDAFGDHALPEGAFNSFSEAQALRNNSMALLIRNYVARNPGKTVVVVAGVGHAMRRAVAEPLAKEGGIASKIVMPMNEGIVEKLEGEDADYFVSP